MSIVYYIILLRFFKEFFSKYCKYYINNGNGGKTMCKKNVNLPK